MGEVSRVARWLLAVAGLALATGARADAPADGEPIERPGAALGRAVALLAEGDTAQADELLEALAERTPLIADHARLLQLRARIGAGRYAEAIALRERFAQTEASPLEGEFFASLGDAHAALGDEPAARAAWRTAHDAVDDEARRAQLQLAIGDSLARSGDRSAAGEAWLVAWRSHPLTPAGEAAAQKLDALERELGRPLRTAVHHRQRGDVLFRNGRNEEALAAYERALAAGPSAVQRRRTERQRAETLFRLRRYREAAEAYAALPQDDEVAIAHARSLARSARVVEAIAELERIAGASRSARARYLAALLLEGEGEAARARQHFELLAQQYAGTSYGSSSLWHLGWAAYREGRYEQAIDAFERLGDRDDEEIGGLRARYWRARADERAGREAQAAAEFAAIAREFPLSYYGWRARQRAGEPVAGERSSLSLDELRGRAALSPRDLVRPEILLEAGLVAEARAELHPLFVRAAGLADRVALANLYGEAGDFHRAERIVVEAYLVPLARGPLPEAIELWWHAWPLPFREEVLEATGEGALVEPQLVYALMREESGYRPEVVSPAGARGLLQLMPSTAERVGAKLGIDAFQADALFGPGLNIRLGTAYLDDLLARFPGRVSAGIGSYNAGPDAVGRWLLAERGEDDEWVEAIPYDETRKYVKRVLRSLHAYRVLY
jgi:soluble lytic murein transglycosylase